METRDCRIELGNLCPQLIDSIFSRIPLKNLTKLKSVSKSWCNFIKQFRRFHPPTTISGLVILLNHIGTNNNEDFQESSFMKVQEGQQQDGGFCSTLNLHASSKHNFPLHLIDSCNGLLLYSANDGQSWTYYVCNPFLDQCLALPRAHEVKRLACTSLAFDESHQENFRLISFFLKEVDVDKGLMGCRIFSSQTWEWRVVEARILNIDLLLEKGFDAEQLFGPSVFCKGRLYWIWSLCMLVYDNGGEFFKLFRLPSMSNGDTRNSLNMLSELLWESDGQIYFCHQSNEQLCIFKFIRGDDFLAQEEHSHSIGASSLWQLNRSVTLKEFIYRKMDCTLEWNAVKLRARNRIRPCAFNQDLQLLYLHISPGRIVSYSMETEEFVQVLSYGELKGNSSSIQKVLPFLFKSVCLFPA